MSYTSEQPQSFDHRRAAATDTTTTEGTTTPGRTRREPVRTRVCTSRASYARLTMR
jgi:hypothetical protein